MSKKEKLIKIHLEQKSDIGYTLETAGSVEDLGEAILSLQAWFISEFIEPEKHSEFLIYMLESIKRKLKTDSIRSIDTTSREEFDKIIDEVMERLGGKQ